MTTTKHAVLRRCFYKSVLYRPGDTLELEDTDRARYQMLGMVGAPLPEPKTKGRRVKKKNG